MTLLCLSPQKARHSLVDYVGVFIKKKISVFTMGHSKYRWIFITEYCSRHVFSSFLLFVKLNDKCDYSHLA